MFKSLRVLMVWCIVVPCVFGEAPSSNWSMAGKIGERERERERDTISNSLQQYTEEDEKQSRKIENEARSLAALIENPDHMANRYGFAPAPIYVLCMKGYFNFFFAVILLLGWKLLAQSICPLCFGKERFDAHTGKTIVEMNGSSLLDDTDDMEYRRPFNIGDCMIFPNECKFQVVCTYSKEEMEAAGLLMLAGSEFDKDPNSCAVAFEGHECAVVNFILSSTGATASISSTEAPLIAKFLEEKGNLRGVTFEKTIQSKLLSNIQTKISSLLFQLAGIFSAGYSLYVIFIAAEIQDWKGIRLGFFLLSQHSAVITLIVTTSQVAIFARYSVAKGESSLWSAVLLICHIEIIPSILGIIAIGWYGFLVYLVLPCLLGVVFLPLLGVLLAYKGDPLLLLFDHRGMQYTENLPCKWYRGRGTKDIQDEYDSKGLLGKGVYMLMILLPQKLAFFGGTVFMVIAYLVVMLVAVPIAWVFMCGFEGVPAALAIFLEVIVPFLVLVAAAAKVAFSQPEYLGRSGPTMILVFVLSQTVAIFVSLLVPASILLQETNLGMSGALPLAYSKRHGATYSIAILNSFHSALGESETKLEEVGVNTTLAEGTLNIAQVAVSQLLALIA